MNQLCKVCGEPAAGFHFGAFTCEGCKSFFGRTYNNLSSLSECKNSGRCVINKKTRTSCKSCRLRKCLMVGMSKSGSRYGRRSNWFKIHYLMNSGNESGSPEHPQAQGADDFTMTELPSSTAALSPISSSQSISSGMNSVRSEQIQISSEFKFSSDYKLANDFRLCPELSFPNGLRTDLDLRLSGNDLRSAVDQQSGQDIRSNDSKSTSDLRLSDIGFGLDFKGLNSPTPSSSESHNSDTSQDQGEKSIFSNYNEPLCAKDILGLYNLPTLTPRLPPYINPTSLAQRYLYPYYPSILSVYSRKQYLDNLLKEARQASSMNSSANEIRDVPSPRREIPPPPKLFKPNPEQMIKLCAASSPKEKNPLDMFSISALRNRLEQRSDINTEVAIVPRKTTKIPEAPENFTLPIAAAAPQDTPIDLSVKIKSSSCPSSPSAISSRHISSPGCDSSSSEVNKSVTIKSENQIISGETKADEQQNPLDLSSIRS